MYIIFLGPATLKGQTVTFPCIEGGQIIVYLACDEDGYVSFDCSHRNLHLGIPVSHVRFRPFFPLICEILILLKLQPQRDCTTEVSNSLRHILYI